MPTKPTNPLNAQFWVDEEYGQHPTHHKVTQALTATYGAIGIAHLIERSISEMQQAKFTEHEYLGLEPILVATTPGEKITTAFMTCLWTGSL